MFFELAFLFMLGSVSGWIMELFFRRFVSMKKWINPGFLNGPYLPMYGCGTVLLFGACFIPLPRWAIILILTCGLTLLEYVTGLIFIKGMKIKLWDYSDRRGNIQGIICPLFSLFLGIIAAIFVCFLFEPLQTATAWAAGSIWMLFFVGIFYGPVHQFQCFAQDPQGGRAVQDGGALRGTESVHQRAAEKEQVAQKVFVPVCGRIVQRFGQRLAGKPQSVFAGARRAQSQKACRRE